MNKRGFSAPVLGSLFLLAACARAPSETEPDIWQLRGDEPVVSVCYTAAVSTRQQVEAFAHSLCPAGYSGVELIDHDNFLNNCPLSKRNRATFLCEVQ